MNETEFNELAEQAIEQIQDAIDDSGADIDYDEVGGVLTLELDDGSKIIFSRQAPVKQLWMAAKSGGFHFDFDEQRNCWVCDSGTHEELFEMLSRLVTEQSGEDVTLAGG